MTDKAQRYGEALNSYDLLKLVALATMILDHVGYYLLPEAEWIRAIGRCSFPIWLFLAGYGRHLPISKTLVVCAALVAVMEWLYRDSLLTLNILVSITLTRLLLRWLEHKNWLTRDPYAILAGGIVFYPVTVMLWDYGSFALLFAVLGYAAYHQQRSTQMHIFFAFTWAFYWLFQAVGFSFAPANIALMMLACAPVAWALFRFRVKPDILPETHPLTPVLRLLSRHSLYVYVAHMAILVALGCWLGNNA